jgi:hypothetical protein
MLLRLKKQTGYYCGVDIAGSRDSRGTQVKIVKIEALQT